MKYSFKKSIYFYQKLKKVIKNDKDLINRFNFLKK